MYKPTYFTNDEFIRSAFFLLPVDSTLLKAFKSDPLSFFPDYALRGLDRVRQFAGIPLILTASYRSAAWDKSKGRSGTGDHPLGHGFDVAVHGSAERRLVVEAAIKADVPRIGVASTFVHLGFPYQDDTRKPVLWTY